MSAAVGFGICTISSIWSPLGPTTKDSAWTGPSTSIPSGKRVTPDMLRGSLGAAM
jgi:hypothetical protein